MSAEKYILFDAANTLIHKPALWSRMLETLSKHGYPLSESLLRKNHKLLSEVIRFPDRTSPEFYTNFNSELLFSLGIVPNPELLDDLFKSCTYLPWEAFPDTSALADISVNKGILSNFKRELEETITGLLGNQFKHIISSEGFGAGKPDLRFFEHAIKVTGVEPQNILYIGDSIKLDVQPGSLSGMRSLLIDRDDIYPSAKNRIRSLHELVPLI